MALGKHAGVLKKWRNGFVTLDGDLVERLAKRGLEWGATFHDRIDLNSLFHQTRPRSSRISNVSRPAAVSPDV
jgi:hypothetical protein